MCLLIYCYTLPNDGPVVSDPLNNGSVVILRIKRQLDMVNPLYETSQQMGAAV